MTHLTSQQKKLFAVVAILFILVLVVRVVPALQTWYEEQQQSLEQLELRVEQLQRLIQNEAQWQKKLEVRLRQNERLAQQLFPSGKQDVVSARIQAALKKHAAATNLNIASMKLPEFVQHQHWLLVQQEFDFSATVSDMEAFLQRLEQANPRLHVMTLDLRQQRNDAKQMTGTLGVSAFSKIEQ